MITLRTQLNEAQGVMYATIRSILKCERESLIEWLSLVVISNLARSKMRFNSQSTSTDGFLINIGAICVRLCSFANSAKPKVYSSQKNNHNRFSLISWTQGIALPTVAYPMMVSLESACQMMS